MNLKLFIFVMGFGSGFSASSRGGLKVISGSHGQVLRFHSGSAAVYGGDDLKFTDTEGFNVTASMNVKGDMVHSGSIEPEEGGVHRIGSASKKYHTINMENVQATNVFTGDLHMKNERGDWTIFEEKTSLIVQNNLTGQRFKLVMEEIED
jgi:hypothetical protein